MVAEEQIWRRIAAMDTPGFFITADIIHIGVVVPVGLETFIDGKLAQIHQGIVGRKFAFSEGGWRIHLTFFHTDRRVDERYALKNKPVKGTHGE